jgi:hypothetical protein
MSTEKKEPIPEEFKKIIKDFISDILITFPEYEPIVSKWWVITDFSELPQDKQDEKMEFIFKHCLAVFPERFFDILYQTPDMFGDSSTLNTEFLPGISFKYLFKCDISDKTRETMWKYLQLILLALVGSMKNKTAFGDTAKLFESINEDEFKGKLEETLGKIQQIFQGTKSTEGKNEDAEGNDTEGIEGTKFGGVNMDNLPNADEIQDHISGMLGGKLGQLAKEIAEETADSLNIDMENVTDAKDVFQNLFKNPGKLMGLVKNVGDKLNERIKSGDIKENELYSEATEIMNRMKDMPGLDNIQGLLKKMGMAGGIPGMAGGMAGAMAGMDGGGMPNLGRNTKLDTNAMKNQSERLEKSAKMKEKLKQRSEMKNAQKIVSEMATKAAFDAQFVSQKNALSDDALVALIDGQDKGQDKSSKKKKSKK